MIQDIPYGHCRCGCGRKTPLATRNRYDIGHVKGEPIRFIRGHQGSIPATDGHKFCRRCGKEKPLADFATYIRHDRGGVVRRRPSCRSCVSAANKLRRLTHPPKKRVRRMTEKQKQANRARAKAWKRANPEKARAAAVRDQHRRRGAPFDAKSRRYAEVLNGDPCAYCGWRTRITIDHIVPVSSGGGSHWTNLAGACLKCNSGKGTKSLLGYILHRQGVAI